MKSLIAFATLLASVAVSAGELDGKAVTCDADHLTAPIGFEFRGDRAIAYEITTQDSKAVIREFGSGEEYKTTPTTVIWWELYRLDRETLWLQFRTPMRGVMFEYQCQVTTSLDSFRATLEAARLEEQKAIDERMKDNKI